VDRERNGNNEKNRNHGRSLESYHSHHSHYSYTSFRSSQNPHQNNWLIRSFITTENARSTKITGVFRTHSFVAQNLPARASVDDRVEVKSTQDHVNSAADRGLLGFVLFGSFGFSPASPDCLKFFVTTVSIASPYQLEEAHNSLMLLLGVASRSFPSFITE
jgi:hypothetical protein